MQEEEIQKLVERYLAGHATADDKRRLNDWYRSFDDMRIEVPVAETGDLERVLQTRILESTGLRKPRLWMRWAAAAAIVLVAGGLYLLQLPKSGQSVYPGATLAVNIPPGGYRAILTLQDGRQIALSAKPDPSLAARTGLRLRNPAAGQLVFEPQPESGTTGGPAASGYVRIETPAGGQYEIILADGSHVWLNAASKLRFPNQFTASERRVELQGEGFFKVAKNKKRPFRVIAGSQVVEVLGTEFNLNAYQDEHAVRTTLVKGSVRLLSGAAGRRVSETVLEPGQQAAFTNAGFSVSPVNTERITDWKSGEFNFADEDIRSSLRKLARWYNVDIQVEGDFSEVAFGGSISRSKSLNEVLRVLKLSRKIHFKVEGRRITVTP